MSNLTLSPEHEYAVDGRQVLGVSKILHAAGLIDTSFLSEEGKKRGSYVHQTVELYVKDELEADGENLHEELAGYLSAYRKFERESGFVVAVENGIYQVEIPRFHELYGFAGTPDLYGSIGSRRFVVDVKSGDPDDWHKDQLALYAMLRDPEARPERANLYLRPDGSFRWIERKGREDYDVAKAALTIARARIARGLLK